MHIKRTWEAGASVAVHESFFTNTRRIYGKRAEKAVSRAAVKAYNDKISKRNFTLKINTNFLPGDGNVTLQYFRDNRPEPEGAPRHWKEFCKKMRKAAKRAGVAFKWAHAVGVGVKGAIHHHAIVNKECLPFLAECWAHGYVHIEPLYGWKNYQKLAKYFCGQEKGENPDDKKEILIHGNKYSTSRNLEAPKEFVDVMQTEKWEKYPAPQAGYLIDVDSVDVGINPVTLSPYRFYIAVQLAAPKYYAGERRREWEEKELAKNRALVEWKVNDLLRQAEEKQKRYAVGL